MNEQSLVQESLQEIFSMNGYNDPELMTQRNFEHISTEIEKKSGILISSTTIKRLSKGAFNRSPQIATLNAIANYFDFTTWQEYKSSLGKRSRQTIEAIETPKETVDIADSNALEKKERKQVMSIWIFLLIVPVFILGYYIYPNSNRSGNFEKATFSARKTTGNDLPNTVVFNYDVDKVKADSFFIQQSWDKNRRVRIYKNNHTLTDIYYEPGYHVAKLIANDSVIKTFDINIPTDKWVFYANENKAGYSTEYIKTEISTKDGTLAVTKEELLKSGIDVAPEKMYLYSYFPSGHEVSGDNFILTTRVRMKEIRNNRCPYIAIEVYGQRYFMLIKSTSKGCANLATLWFSERAINGRENDLSSITYDVAQWTDVELLVKDKKASIKINSQEAFSTTYKQSLQKITGVSFISNGLCEVEHVALLGLDGTEVYKDNFDR
jgi:hypothetical protein